MSLTVSRWLSFTRCLRLCLAVLLIMTLLFFGYVWAEKQVDLANNQRYKTQLLIDELRQSSDDLTRMIRSYIVTGNVVYLRYFEEILAIRDGKAPRPAQYDSVYWDLIAAGIRPKPSADDKVVPLLELMEKAGFNQPELDLLSRAKKTSDALANTEIKAANLLNRETLDKQGARQQAEQLVFGPAYLAQKAEIMSLLDQVIKLSDTRTRYAVDREAKWVFVISLALIVFGVVLLVLIWLCEKLFRQTLGAPPKTVYRSIQSLGTGRFDPLSIVSPEYPENSVMSHLAQAQAQLKQLEDQRNSSQQSLQLMSKVFSEAQEGVFLTDLHGIVLDVNLAYLCMTGYSRKECLGAYAAALKSEQCGENFYQDFWAVIKKEGRWRGEIWNQKKNGELFASILNFSAVNDDDGNLLCYLGMLTDITQLKKHQQEIEEIAYHDTLTALPNRSLLADRMQQALARAERNKHLLAVICLDLDGFKAVNDNFGHGAGDKLLVEVGQRLLNCVRSGDTVARLGGDEFAILLSEIDVREDCETTLQRILTALITPYNICHAQITSISGSLGYTLFPFDNADPDTLLRHADQAMYIAKQAGKNRFHYFDVKENKRVQANRSVLSRIEQALTNQEMRLYVQPKINLTTAQVVGAEVLIRWQHPIRGITSPLEFLPLIEDHDIAIWLGEWVIAQALLLMKDWRQQGIDLPLSVNISPRQIRQANFYERLAVMMEEFPDMPPGQLELEIVESAALDDLQQISELIGKCKKLGVYFALDDFGTGYSALIYLKRLAVATLKIDQSFVRDLLDDENDLAIVRGVIGLAKAFNMNIIAEGVENWQQAQCLLNLGCEIAQGYAIAYPMPSEQIVDWLAQFHMPVLTEE